MAICSSCAAGNCSECRGRVHLKRTTSPCRCRHTAEAPAGDRPMRPADPRRVGGAVVDVAGDGSPLIDTTRALIPTDLHTAAVYNQSDGRQVMAMLVDGNINRTDEQVTILQLLNPDAAAAMVSEVVGLAARMGAEFELEFRQLLEDRMDVAELWPAAVRP